MERTDIREDSDNQFNWTRIESIAVEELAKS